LIFIWKLCCSFICIAAKKEKFPQIRRFLYIIIFHPTGKKTILKFVKQTLAKAYQNILDNSSKHTKSKYTYNESIKIVSTMMSAAVHEKKGLPHPKI
jgi:hypothetical protein